MNKGKQKPSNPPLKPSSNFLKFAWLVVLSVTLTSFIVSHQVISQEYLSFKYLDFDDDNFKTGVDDDWMDKDGSNDDDEDKDDDTIDANVKINNVPDKFQKGRRQNSRSNAKKNDEGENDNYYLEGNDKEEDDENEEDDEYLEKENENEEDDEYLEKENEEIKNKTGEKVEESKPSIPIINITEAASKLQTKIQKVEQMEPIPFYMYDHPNITLENAKLSMFAKKVYRIGSEALNDLATIHALNMSSWKTSNPKEAKLFIIPIPMGRIASSTNQEYYDVAYSTLVNNTIFKETMGHRHVLPASPFLLFRGDKYKEPRMMVPWMPFLWNVTVAQSYDQNAIINAARNKLFDFKEYTPTFEKLNAMNKRTFSIGLSGGTNFPLREIHDPRKLKKYNFPLTLASTEKFNSSSNFIFYHTPPNFTCFHNSTIFRDAPITNITRETFPKSELGHGIEKRELWINTYKDSKFCLCIRGDSPHSHAFFRSIRSGCIPVIASDALPIYSPILKHTLEMSDYTIMIDEEEVVRDTHNLLMKLNDLDKDYIDTKIKNLQFAQRVWFHDHPESLFVKAFLYEALHASEVDDSLNPYGDWR